jgi:hypothetical protein
VKALPPVEHAYVEIDVTKLTRAQVSRSLWRLGVIFTSREDLRDGFANLPSDNETTAFDEDGALL